MDRLKLGTMLVEAKLLTDDQLKKAVEFQKAVGGKLGAIIVKLGFVSDDVLTTFLARQMGLPIIHLSELVLPWNLVKRIPRKLVEKHQILPIAFKDGVLTVVMADPFDYEALEEVQLATNYRVEVNLAGREQIKKAIADVLYREPEPAAEKTKEEILKDLEEAAPPAAAAPAPAGEPPTAAAAVSHPPSMAQIQKALVALLVERRIITEKELMDRARQVR